jgi:hypothetical protein
LFLDEFVALTGYHRKHAIRVLNRPQSIKAITKRARSRLYDEARAALADCPVGGGGSHLREATAPLLPALVPALERHGHLRLEASDGSL